MDAHDNPMSAILSGEKQYIIPVFQRFYSWEKKQWETLWQDIIAITGKDDSPLTHFIGPFVVIAKATPYDITRFLVIDGQQRLITITVMLCALRDRAKALNLTALANAIETNSLIFQDTSGEKQAKIIPRIRDRDTLLQIIHSKKEPLAVDSLLTKAYKYFSGQIENISQPQTGLWDPDPVKQLENLYHAIIRRLLLVTITLDHNDNPSNIFESLNFKGEKLSDADLIRNYAFMQVDIERQETFNNNTWKPFEDLFEKNGQLDTSLLTDFYYRYLISKNQYFSRARLYTKFTKYIDKFAKKDNLIELVNELKQYARRYIKTINAQDDESLLQLALERFNMLDVATATPLLLDLYNRYENEDENKKLSLSAFVSMLEVLESFILRRSILRWRTRGYGLDFAKAIEQSTTLDELINYLVGKGWPTDEEIKNALNEFPIYRHEPKKCRLIMTKIERSFGHKEKTKLEGLTVEHVLPQSLAMPWRQALGPNADEIHERYLHTIGNLTLSGYNPELSDYPFPEKKKIYAESKLQLNAYFADHDVWTEKEILERSQVLADKIVKLWWRPDSTENGSNGKSDQAMAQQQSLL